MSKYLIDVGSPINIKVHIDLLSCPNQTEEIDRKIQCIMLLWQRLNSSNNLKSFLT